MRVTVFTALALLPYLRATALVVQVCGSSTVAPTSTSTLVPTSTSSIAPSSTASPPPGSTPASPLDSFVALEQAYAFGGVLASFGGGGVNAPGVASGLIVASPSKSSPDYFFTWTRDSALVTKALVENLVATGNSSLASTLQDYANAQVKLAQVNNPSGGFSTGGLGEPKYNVDGSAFTGAWGRPQRDGPALRAITLIGYARYLLANGGSAFVSSTLAPLITADLGYVVTYWNQTGFDLWEEVQGSSFFTVASQHRALVEGLAFSTSMGATNPIYDSTARDVLCFLQSFWSSSSGYVVSNINGGGRSGKDANSILGSIHTFDSAATTCDSTTFQPCSDRALANHKVVTDAFRSIYTINSGLPAGTAVAVGRYPEDSYYGGNPWYLNTLAAAEQLYDAVYTWNKAGSITITPISLAFFQDVYSAAAVGTYASSTPAFASIVAAVRTYADGFVAVVKKYTPASGGLAEQYDRNTGAALSARDLTWSYASFLTVAAARAGIVPPPWGSTGRTSSCGTGSGGSGGGSGGGGGTTPPPAGSVQVTFNEIASTVYGENVLVVGSLPQLGNWNPANAIPLSASKYTASNNLWFTTISLPPSTDFQYKFIRKAANGSIKWQSDPNQSARTNASGTQTLSSTFK